MERVQIQELAERLERAEDDFFNLIERYPHLLKDPRAVAIIYTMKTAISDLRAATPS